jgi:hypothetical protein
LPAFEQPESQAGSGVRYFTQSDATHGSGRRAPKVAVAAGLYLDGVMMTLVK